MTLFTAPLPQVPDYGRWSLERFPTQQPELCLQKPLAECKGFWSMPPAIPSEPSQVWTPQSQLPEFSLSKALTESSGIWTMPPPDIPSEPPQLRRLDRMLRSPKSKRIVDTGSHYWDVLQTPESKKGVEFQYATPEVERQQLSHSTPLGPQKLRSAIDIDIEAALQQGSVWLLSLALLRSHCCSCDHSLHEAVQRNNFKAVELILVNDASTIDHHCKGCRPLHLAISASMVECDTGYQIAKKLLEHNSSPNYVDGDDVSRGCPLHDATRRGCIGLASMLLQFGAEPNFQGPDLSTALHIGCKQVTLYKDVMHDTYVSSLKRLLASQADPNIIDNKGHFPGCYLEDFRSIELMRRAQLHWHKKTMALVCHSFNCSSDLKPNSKMNTWLVPETLMLIVRFL